MPNLFSRQIETTAKRFARQFKIVGIIGPRQSGKTTLVLNLFKKYKYHNLENLNTYTLASSDITSFLDPASFPVVIDEAQLLPEMFNHLQFVVDSLNKKGQVIITGSSNLALMEYISQSLAGRIGLLYLLPLNLYELKRNRIIKGPSFDTLQLIWRGFYPQALAERDLNVFDFYSNYIATYVERDVRRLQNIKNYADFIALLRLLSGRIGQLIDYTDLANGLSVSRTTVKEWISLLEVGFIVFKLYPYYNNYGKRFIKKPKVYLIDTGIACNLLNIADPEQLEVHFAKGALFENMVIMDYIKTAYNLGMRPNAYFIRTTSGAEVDLLIEGQGGELHAIEIKSSKTLKPELVRGLDFIKNLVPAVKTYLVYQGEESKVRYQGHAVFSVYDLPELWLQILKGSSR